MVSRSHSCKFMIFRLQILSLLSSFVAILFADAIQRMFRVTAEVDIMKSGRQGIVQDYKSDTSMAARKF